MSTELLATFTTKDVTKPCHCSSNLNSKPSAYRVAHGDKPFFNLSNFLY
jgi:hypothetical protein